MTYFDQNASIWLDGTGAFTVTRSPPEMVLHEAQDKTSEFRYGPRRSEH
jgi:hypothetical protein